MMAQRKKMGGRAFGSESRVSQVHKRLSDALGGGLTVKILQADGGIKITADKENVPQITQIVSQTQTRGVEVRLNGRMVAGAPNRDEHLAARSKRASNPPPQSRANRVLAAASA